LLIKNLEIEVLRLTQRIVTMEKFMPVELQTMKEIITSKNKELQFYIETLH
jgi:hypothetical protein